MGRFDGWTEEAILKITNRKLKKKRRITKRKTTPDYVGAISKALDTLGIEHVREYKFLANRKFRFDIAIPDKKIAIEFEGGIFSGGRHTRGKGYARDVEKYNLAVLEGWKVLRYTTENTKTSAWEYAIAGEIARLAGIAVGR